MRSARSRGVVGATSSGIARPCAASAAQSSSDSSSGTSGTIAPSAPAAARVARETLDAVLIDRIEVGEEDHRRAAALAAARCERETSVNPRSAGKRALPGGRDRRAVGERIAVGNPELDHVGANGGDRRDHRFGRRRIRIAGHQVRNERGAAFGARAHEDRLERRSTAAIASRGPARDLCRRDR